MPLDKNLLWELGKTISKQHPSSNLISAKTFSPSCTRTFQSDSYKIAFDPLEHHSCARAVFWLESSGPGQQAKGKRAEEGVSKRRCELSSAHRLAWRPCEFLILFAAALGGYPRNCLQSPVVGSHRAFCSSLVLMGARITSALLADAHSLSWYLQASGLKAEASAQGTVCCWPTRM